MLEENSTTLSKWPADKVKRWPIERLVPYARNARTHSDEQIAQVAASIQEWGWTNPVLVGEDGGIIAGHCRVLAGRQLGLTEVPVMLATGWSEAQKRAYVLADNQLALNAGWNPELLRLELGDLKELDFNIGLIGFGDAELAALTANPGLTDPDEVPEAPAVPVAQLGEVWQLGRHRLMCGDATSAEDVAKVLGGVSPHLMVTDPPYGVELDMEWRDRAGHNEMAPASRSYMKIAMNGEGMSGDTRCDWSDGFALVPSLEVVYVWHSTSHLIEVGQGLTKIGFQLRQQIIWSKTVAAMSRSAYHWKHEPCWYAVRIGKTARWCGSKDQTTIWEAASPKHIMSGSKEEKVDHPTQKPVVLYTRPIENHTVAGQAVFEPFNGSGTAIIACEMTARKCIAMEIEPRFVDVSIERWQNFTGEKARRQEAA